MPDIIFCNNIKKSKLQVVDISSPDLFLHFRELEESITKCYSSLGKQDLH